MINPRVFISCVGLVVGGVFAAGCGQPAADRVVSPTAEFLAASETPQATRASAAASAQQLRIIDDLIPRFAVHEMVAMANEGRANRKQWFGRATLKNDPDRFCDAAIKLVVRQLDLRNDGGEAGVTKRQARAEKFVRLAPECSRASAASVFGSSFTRTPLAAAPLSSANAAPVTAVQDDSLDVWIDENYSQSEMADAAWAETQSSASTVAYEYGGSEMMVFGSMRRGPYMEAALTGCLGAIWNGWGLVKASIKAGLVAAGPLSGFTAGMLTASALCGGGALAGMYIHWLAT